MIRRWKEVLLVAITAGCLVIATVPLAQPAGL